MIRTRIQQQFDPDQGRDAYQPTGSHLSEEPKEDRTMSRMTHIGSPHEPVFSPLLLSDRLLTLAEDADKAGYRTAAESLLFLASKVLDQPSLQRH
jgi:hypothetical protein